MKILMISPASRTVFWFRQELINYLQDKGNVVEIIVCDDEYKKEIEQFGVPVYIVEGDNTDTGIFSNLKYINKLKKLVKQLNPDKIMTFQAKANAFGIIACKLAGFKDIHAMVEGLGTAYNKNGIKGKFLKIVSNILYKIAFHKIPTVIFLNDDNISVMKKYHNVKDNQILQIEGIGLDLDKFKYQPLEKINEPIKFVMIARQFFDKGVREYCECAKKIIDENKYNVEFHYVGMEAEATEYMSSYIKENYIIYDGGKLDIPNYLPSIDVVVLPSYHEGAPRTLMEACAVGRCILASNIVGCKVVCQNEINGLLFNKKDVNDLYQKCCLLLENRNLTIEYGKNGREYAENHFDANKINKIVYNRLNNSLI